jgi:cytochrome c biogenesis protein CcmG, thiol:disulfide interchange protein DsbE
VDEPVAEPGAAPATAPADTPADASAETASAPSRWRWLLRGGGLAIVVALLGLLVWATLHATRGESLVARIAAGDKPPAPHFDLAVIWRRDETWPPQLRRALGDDRLDLHELRGRPVVMNFWASWCIPCRDEAPLLSASARAHRGQAVFLGVNVQDLTEDALEFLREFDAPYVSIRDRNNKTFDDYGLTGVPETYYLDARGRIVGHVPGAISRRTLEQGVAAVMAGARRLSG